jgi:WD40 repeat protein
MLEFNHDGSQLLSASDDATARLWRLANRTALVLRGHDDDVYRARFSADERNVATASLDGSARVWSIDHPPSTTYVEGEPIEGLRFVGDQAYARTAGSMVRWDLVSGEREPLFSWAEQAHNLGYGVVSNDGEHAAIPNADGSLELRDRRGASVVLRGHRGLITHVEFTRDGSVLWSSSSDGTLRRWDVATGAAAVVIEGTIPIRGFALARDGRVAAQAGDIAYLVDAAGAVTQLGRGSAWCIGYAEFEPVRDHLVIHRCDKTLAIVDGTHVIELLTGGYTASHVVMSTDGRQVACGLSDRTIRLWDAATGRVIDVLRGHSDFVFDVAFSPDGSQLASASYDKTIRVWELATKRHRVLRGHTAPVTHVTWRGADQLATASPDGTIRLWTVPSLEPPSDTEIAERLNEATSARIDRDRLASDHPISHGT